MKNRSIAFVVAVMLAWFVQPAVPGMAQTRESAIVDSAAAVLNEIMVIPARMIPLSLMADAQGVAIIPGVVKIGFVAGLRHGQGVVLLRDQQGAWRPPLFLTLTGGSVGWQAGIQSTDIVLVFKTHQSVERLMTGKITLGVDAAAAAGPVGRRAEAATDARLKAEIYSYSRSRGLFAGVSFDGSALQIDHWANAVYYGGDRLAADGHARPHVPLPPSAARLMELMSRYTAAPVAANLMAGHADSLVVPAAATQPAAARQELARLSRQLDALLDQRWRSYLALPAEVFADQQHASVEALSQSLKRFDAVVADPRYRVLALRPEFRSTHELLKRYRDSQTAASQRLALPPPPDNSGWNVTR